MVQNFVQEKNLGATKLQAKDFEIENLEINVLTQNFEIIKIHCIPSKNYLNLSIS